MRGKQETIWAYVFLLPALIGFLAFTVGPVVGGFLMSLTEWDLVSPPKFVGFLNYRRLFTVTQPLYFVQALKNTLWVAASTPIGIAASLFLAMLVNQKVRGVTWFRTIYYLPVVTAMAVVAMAWIWIYDPIFGPLNFLLNTIGLPGPEWLNSTTWALPAIVLMGIWKGAGWGMVILLAGLQGIPEVLYDAAKIDGANWWQQFRRVTLPLLTPTLFFLMVMGVIGSFQTFEQIYIMTKGGPGNTTATVVYFIYQNAFQWNKMGFASAGAYALFLVILIFTLIQFKLQEKWVHYEL